MHITSPTRALLRASWLLALILTLLASLGPVPARAQQTATADWWSAIRRDDASALQGMLLRHADPNAVNAEGTPSLVQAARDQSWQVFDVLRSAPGIQIDQPNALDETALMYLCILGDTQRAVDLIRAGAQVNRLGWTPLHYAASKARMDTARMLIEHGAIVNAPGPDGTTPLMMAALSGKADMVRLLLQHGADATMFNSAHQTAADWARRGNSLTLAAALDDLASRVTQARRSAAAAPEAGPDQQGGQSLSADGVPSAGTPAPDVASGSGRADDPASFSRYFDLGRFEDPGPGK